MEWNPMEIHSNGIQWTKNKKIVQWNPMENR